MAMSRLNTSGKIVFEQCVSEIEEAYAELGHNLGWRFLSVGKDILDAPVKIALITLNPGGNINQPEHPSASCEAGVSYLIESWGGSSPGESKLQIQVRGLFRMLADAVKFNGTYQQLMAQSLIAHFIPFRSPRLADLPRQRESIEFGHILWQKLLSVSAPKLIICLGRDVQAELRKLIPVATGLCLENTVEHPTGWGSYRAEIDEFKKDSEIVRLLYLPHLSTWTLFTSQRCANFMPIIIREACKGI